MEATTGSVIMKVVKIGAQLLSPNQTSETTIHTKTEVELRMASTSCTMPRAVRDTNAPRPIRSETATALPKPAAMRPSEAPAWPQISPLRTISDEPGHDGPRGGEHEGPVAAGEQRPAGQDHDESGEGRQVQAAGPVAVAPHARWKNSRRMRSGLSQRSDLRKPNSLFSLSWTIRVSICSSGRPESMRTVSL